MQLDLPEKLALIKKHLQYGFHSITPTLNLPPPQLHPDFKKDAFTKTGSKLVFVDDSAQGPNAGWIWANHGYYQFKYNLPINHVKRSWGYVFWDQKRLERGGILDSQPGAGEGIISRTVSDMYLERGTDFYN